MSAETDVVIIGGGIVGLFCARELARDGWSVVLLEREHRFCEGASSRNSGVLHAGIYYRPGSRKARLCVEGARRSYELARQWNAPFRRCGKLLVALNDEEAAALAALKRKGDANGVEGLTLVDSDFIRRREPYASGLAGLWSPATGVIDLSEWTRAVRAQAEAEGALLLSDAQVTHIDLDTPGQVTVRCRQRGAITARAAINAAGVAAANVARLAGLDEFTPHPVRGSYATIIPRRADLVTALLYPVPNSKLSLGVHFTRTTGDEILVGPTAEEMDPALADPDLSVAQPHMAAAAEPPPRSYFHAMGRALLPTLREDDLRPGYFGLRAKVTDAAGSLVDDFQFRFQPDAPPVLHLIGFDSPALTSSPAIGREVAALMAQRLG